MLEILTFVGIVSIIVYYLLSQKKMSVVKRRLYLISLVSAILLALFPANERVNFLRLGSPAENFLIFDGRIVGFNPLGFFFNFFIVYIFLLIIVKFYRILFTKSRNDFDKYN